MISKSDESCICKIDAKVKLEISRRINIEVSGHLKFEGELIDSGV